MCLYPSVHSTYLSYTIESKTLRIQYNNWYSVVILYAKRFVRRSFMNHDFKLLLKLWESDFSIYLKLNEHRVNKNKHTMITLKINKTENNYVQNKFPLEIFYFWIKTWVYIHVQFTYNLDVLEQQICYMVLSNTSETV